MKQLSAVVLERHERDALRRLGTLGAVQLTRAAAGDATAPVSPPDRSRELARLDRILGRVAEIRRVLGIETVPVSAPVNMNPEEAERTLGALEERAGAWVRGREQLQRQAQELQARCEQLGPYGGLELPLDLQGASSLLHFVTGTVPAGAAERMPNTKERLVLPLPAHKGRQAIVAFSTGRNSTALLEALRQAGFQHDALPVARGSTPGKVLVESRAHQGQVARELESTDQEGATLAATAGGPLGQIQQWAAVERRLIEAEQLFPRTETSVLIKGWIPASEVARVRGELEACTAGCCAIESTEPTGLPEEEVPVLLRHSRFLRPFEVLVTSYGLPKYGELAPTLFVAISYVLMFGMMFGDVGHGLLLAAAGAALLLTSRAVKRRDAGVLLLANGLSSAGFGAAYGSCFGLPAFKEHALWRDPLEGDPMDLMLLAIGLGVVLMSVGVILNIVNRVRRGEWALGLLDKFGVIGVVFYWGSLLLLTQAAWIRARGWWTWAMVAFLVLPIGCWILEPPLSAWRHRRAGHAGHAAENGGMVAAWTEALVGAFEGVLLYLANTISFVRLAAYAMSHAALLVAAFALAAQVRSMSGGGVVLSTAVIILGNVVAIVLEGIVAAVQALRLEYYEFFGKFLSGDGPPFKPFLLVTEKPG